MSKELRMEIKVRNNLVLKRMEEMDIPTVAELCRLMGCPKQQTEVGAILNFKISPLRNNPLNETKKWRPVVRKLAAVLIKDPEDLFPPSLQAIKMPEGAKIFAELSPREFSKLAAKGPIGLLEADLGNPENSLIDGELKGLLNQILTTLTPGEEKVIRYVFGIDDGNEKTDSEVGVLFGVTAHRIKQIKAKALRKLRHPTRSKVVRGFLKEK